MSEAISLVVSSPTIILKQDAATVLPDELLSHTLSFLSPEDLARASGVCREWSRLASALWNEFDLKKICKVIDQAVWEKHVDLAALGLDASGAPAIDKRIVIPFLKRLSRQVEGNAGVTLLTMPKGLTLNKLIVLAAAPKQGPSTQFVYIARKVCQELGNVAVAKTYTMVITNSVLKGSRNKSPESQGTLVQKTGGELPGFLPAATLAILTYLASPERQPPIRVYGDEPLTLTRCSEQIDGNKLAVGNFSRVGLDSEEDYYSDDYYGAGVAKMF